MSETRAEIGNSAGNRMRERCFGAFEGVGSDTAGRCFSTSNATQLGQVSP
jgi:hypothetical protein